MSLPPPPNYSTQLTQNPFRASVESSSQTKVKKGASWVLVVLLFLVIGGLGFSVWFLYDQNQKLQAHMESEISEAQTQIDTLKEENQKLNELLVNRETFGLAWDDFKGALSEAEAYFNTDEWFNQGKGSFDVVVNEMEDPAVISNETEKMKTLTASIVKNVDGFEVQLSKQEKDRKAGVGTVAREALDNVDPNITITIVDKACNTEGVLACVTSLNPNSVQVTAEYVNERYDLWYSVMMHEYAHVKQFDNYSNFISSERFKTLFNSDPELQADCMAQSRIGEKYISTYDNTCSTEQLQAASEAWNGNW